LEQHARTFEFGFSPKRHEAVKRDRGTDL